MEYDEEHDDDYYECDEEQQEEYYGENGDEEVEEDEEDNSSYAVEAILDRKTAKGSVLFLTKWVGQSRPTWETKEAIIEHGGRNFWNKFEDERLKRIKEAEEEAKRNRKPRQAAPIGPTKPNPVQALIATFFQDPGLPSYDLGMLPNANNSQGPTEVTKSVKSGERSRVKTLRSLATTAFANAILLYEELGDFPASVKAPVFALLAKNSQLTASHLQVLLSRDQKKLDLSISPNIVSFEHVQAVSERCRELEHFDLHGCVGIGNATQVLAAGCPNLTFLDLSDIPEIVNLTDITHTCRNIKVLRAKNCNLRPTGFIKPVSMPLLELEELDLSGNQQLRPIQVISRLIPGLSPKLRILRANGIGCMSGLNADEEGVNLRFDIAKLKKINYNAKKVKLVELLLGQHILSNCWLESPAVFNSILECLDTDFLEILDLSRHRSPVSLVTGLGNVIRSYLPQAYELTPHLKKLYLSNMVPPRSKTELKWVPMRLPQTLTYLDMANCRLPSVVFGDTLFPPLDKLTDEIAPPRLRYLDISQSQFLTPLDWVRMLRNTYHPLEFLSFSDAGHILSDDLKSMQIHMIRTAVNPLLTTIDLTNQSWLTAEYLKKVLSVEYAPNLQVCKFGMTGNLTGAGVDQALKSPDLPPKLCELSIVGRQMNRIGLFFGAQDLFNNQITRLTLSKCLESPLAAINALRTFKKLKFLQVDDVNITRVSAELADHPLEELAFHCCHSDDFLQLLSDVKCSNVRTLRMCKCMQTSIQAKEKRERDFRIMLAQGGHMPVEEALREVPIPGDHAVTVIIEVCDHWRNTNTRFPIVYEI